MAGNTIYRGPAERQPRTVTGTVSGALLPGALVTFDGSAFTAATAANDEDQLHVLNNNDFAGQDAATAYVSGETGAGYAMEVGQTYQCRMVAGTYAVGAALSVGASGRLGAAATGAVVNAYYKGATSAVSADDLQDVEIANSFKAS